MPHPQEPELEPLFSHEQRIRTWWCLAAGLVSAVLLIPSDVFFARELLPLSKTWKILTEFSTISEFAGNGVTIALILIAVALADVRRRPFALSSFLIVFGAGLCTNLLKVLTVRLRPRNIRLFHDGPWETFLGPWNLSEVPTSHLSFPSGHTTTAFALAYVLTRYYPRGRPVYLLIAASAGFGRVVVRAHYPSDIVVGAVVGWGFSMVAARYLLVEGGGTRSWWGRLSGDRDRGSAPADQPATVDSASARSEAA